MRLVPFSRSSSCLAILQWVAVVSCPMDAGAGNRALAPDGFCRLGPPTVTNRSVQLILEAPLGCTVRVEVSTNLTIWTTLTNLNADQALTWFRDLALAARSLTNNTPFDKAQIDALNGLDGVLTRMMDLALTAADVTLSDKERAARQDEFESLRQSFVMLCSAFALRFPAPVDLNAAAYTAVACATTRIGTFGEARQSWSMVRAALRQLFRDRVLVDNRLEAPTAVVDNAIAYCARQTDGLTRVQRALERMDELSLLGAGDITGCDRELASREFASLQSTLHAVFEEFFDETRVFQSQPFVVRVGDDDIGYTTFPMAPVPFAPVYQRAAWTATVASVEDAFAARVLIQDAMTQTVKDLARVALNAAVVERLRMLGRARFYRAVMKAE